MEMETPGWWLVTIHPPPWLNLLRADWHLERIALTSSVQQLSNSFNSSKSGGMRNSWISSTMMNSLQYFENSQRHAQLALDHTNSITLYISLHKSACVFLPLVPNVSTHTIFHWAEGHRRSGCWDPLPMLETSWSLSLLWWYPPRSPLKCLLW